MQGAWCSFAFDGAKKRLSGIFHQVNTPGAPAMRAWSLGNALYGAGGEFHEQKKDPVD
jgi:hypothetical protein